MKYFSFQQEIFLTFVILIFKNLGRCFKKKSKAQTSWYKSFQGKKRGIEQNLTYSNTLTQIIPLIWCICLFMVFLFHFGLFHVAAKVYYSQTFPIQSLFLQYSLNMPPKNALFRPRIPSLPPHCLQIPLYLTKSWFFLWRFQSFNIRPTSWFFQSEELSSICLCMWHFFSYPENIL